MELTKIFITGRYSQQTHEVTQYLNQKFNGNFIISNTILDCDIYISFDLINTMDLYLNKDMKTVLIRQEPEIVLPENYSKRNIKKFNLIIDVGKQPNTKTIVINWPQNLNQHNYQLFSKQEKFIMVNSDKLSMVKGENYSLRRLVIKEITQLDCYGLNWNLKFITKLRIFLCELMKVFPRLYLLNLFGSRYYFSKNRKWLGNVVDKNQILSNYKYNIVIENSNDYVSEKLFDSFNAGCIPIYVGPNLLNYAIPSDLYIQAGPNVDSIKMAMEEAKMKDYETWKHHLSVWLNSAFTYDIWSKERFVEKILGEILSSS